MQFNFDASRNRLSRQFTDPDWIAGSGLTAEELELLVLELEQLPTSKAVIKAKTFELIVNKAKIAVDRDDIFQDKLLGGKIMVRQRKRWETEVKDQYLPRKWEENRQAWEEFGAYKGIGDYGHTSPNTRLLLRVGFTGLLERVQLAAQKPGLTDRQKDFYQSCQIVLTACVTAAKRLAEAIAPHRPENAAALFQIASGAPRNLYEAMQLLVLYFFLHEYVGGTRVRTLGRLDVLLHPFYQADLANGTFTQEDVGQMLKYFLFKFWCAKVPFDLPFCIGGIDGDGNEVTNEITFLIVETYNELNIHSPKIHVRVSDKTPKALVKLVLSCIRGGNSSIVFIHDNVSIESLLRVGIDLKDARDYVPIGCYEPAVWGVEIGCTGNGGVNLAKAVELVFNNGKDLATGRLCGIETGKIESFPAFLAAIKTQIAHMCEQTVSYVVTMEQHYGQISPDPLLSCQYDHSVQVGVDVLEGGAKYNNSSLSFYSLASLVDSVCAVKKLVFDTGMYSFDALGDLLRQDWKGHENLRSSVLRMKEKYGNNDSVADGFTREFAEFCADLANNRPNGRGGVFKAALFTIDHCFYLGKRTMATPDGRHAGDPLSKNLSANVGMDRRGITALIHSVTKIDHASFPNGSVLDILLHPSAVAGEEGLEAFWGILMTYFKKGGFAMHGNVLDADVLKAAQAHPEQYQTLQVRVCGWNAYFVNLSEQEQNAFIKQAEATV